MKNLRYSTRRGAKYTNVDNAMKAIITKKTPLELTDAMGILPQTGQAEQKKEELQTGYFNSQKKQSYVWAVF